MRFYIVSVQAAHWSRESFVRVVWDGRTNRAVAEGQRMDENLRAFCERLNTEEAAE
jgi:hypothetical protein